MSTCRASCVDRFGRNPKEHGNISAWQDRLEHDLHRGLHDPVTHRRNRQGTQLPTTGLGYEHPTSRLRTPPADLQIHDQLIQQPGYPVLLDIGDGFAVDTTAC